MPLLPLLGIFLVVFLLAIALMPVAIVQRYRAGTARRRARAWVATANLVALALSIGFFLAGAALTTLWVPEAFRYSVAGLTGGALLGLVGLRLSRWEAAPDALHYTPNRWLVLGITLIVTARVAYGFWRGWQAWGAASGDESWLAAAGAAGALAAGAVVLGYYATFWLGVRRRLGRFNRRPAR